MTKILLIDDAPDIRTIGALSLQLSGYEVLEAGSGKAGVALALEEEPDAILLDVMMPGLDGPTTLDALRKAGVRCPVVFLTAKVLGDELAAYEAMGAHGVIAKPFDPLTLAQQLEAFTGVSP